MLTYSTPDDAIPDLIAASAPSPASSGSLQTEADAEFIEEANIVHAEHYADDGDNSAEVANKEDAMIVDSAADENYVAQTECTGDVTVKIVSHLDLMVVLTEH